LAHWYVTKCVSAIQIVKAAADASLSVADQVTDLLDSIPVFGAALNNVLDFVQSMATAGDYTDIIGFLSDPDFATQVQCKLFCSLKDAGAINLSTITTASEVAFNWAALLPPGLPLGTFYGQAFALFGTSVNPNEALRRAWVFSDERSDDCATLCTDCPDEPVSGCHEFDFTGASAQGWDTTISFIPLSGFATLNSDGWSSFIQDDGCSNHGYVYIHLPLGGSYANLTGVELDLKVSEGSFNSISIHQGSGGSIVQSTTFDNGAAITHTATFASGTVSTSDLWLTVNKCGTTGFSIQKIRLFWSGGTAPLTENCP